MWTPNNAQVTSESFDGTVLSGASASQKTDGGEIALVPTFTGTQVYQALWPTAPNWHYSYDFQYSGQTTGSPFVSYTGNGIADYVIDAGSLVIDAASGNIAYVSHSGASGNLVVEISVYATGNLSGQSGATGIHGPGLYIRNHEKHEYIEFHSDKIHFHYHPELDITYDLSTRKLLRFGVSGSNLYFYGEPSLGMIGYTKWDQTASTQNSPIFILGTPSGSNISGTLTNHSGRLEIDSFRFYSGFAPLDRGYISTPTYTTTGVSVWTDPFSPIFPVRSWDSILTTTLYAPGGTTVITPEHASLTGWVSHTGIASTISTGGTTNTIVLSSIPTRKDGTDSIRFKVTQNSTAGSGAAPPVTNMTLLSSFENPRLRIAPSWGPATGDNLVYLGIDNTAFPLFPTPLSQTGDALLLVDSAVGTLSVDTIGNTGTVFGTVTSGALDNRTIYTVGAQIGSPYSFINAELNPPYIAAGPLTTSTGFDVSGLSVGIYGSVATGDYTLLTGNGIYSNLYLFQDSTYDASGNIKYVQGIRTNGTGLGIAINMTGLTSGSRYYLESKLRVLKGDNISFEHNTDTWAVGGVDYINFNTFGLQFLATSPTGVVNIVSSNTGESLFYLDSVYASQLTGGYINYSGITYDGFDVAVSGSSVLERENLYVESRINLLAAPKDLCSIATADTTYASGPPTSGYYLRINDSRNLEFGCVYEYNAQPSSSPTRTSGAIITVTGNRPIPVHSFVHVAGGIHSVVYGTGEYSGARAFVSLNGHIVGSKEIHTSTTSGIPPVFQTTSKIQAYTGAYLQADWLRVSTVPEADPEFMSQSRAGIGIPYFEVDKWFTPANNKAIVLRAASSDGALVSDSVQRNPFIVSKPEASISIYSGVYGKTNVFDAAYKGTACVELDQFTLQDFSGNTGQVAFASWVTWYGESGCLWSVGNTGAYIRTDIDQTGSLRFSTYDDNSLTTLNLGATLVVGENNLNIQLEKDTPYHIGLALDTNNLLVSLDGKTHYTGTWNGSRPLSGAISENTPWYYYLASYLDSNSYLSCGLEETILDSNISEYTGGFSIIANKSTVKTTGFTDKVLVNSVPITGTHVVHYDLYRKYVTMPSGNSAVSVTATSQRYLTDTTGNVGWHLFADRPYRYINTYNLTLDEERMTQTVGRTKSPFTIVQKVPAHAINIAHISQQDFDSEGAVSLIDLSFNNIQNVANYFFGDLSITSPNTGVSPIWYYTGAVDTKDVNLTALTVVDSEADYAYPAYFSYLIGRGRYGVQATVDNINSVKQSIKVFDQDGNEPDPADFAWSVVASGLSPSNSVLGSGIYSAVLISNKRFIPDTTLWVEYIAVPYNSGNTINGFKEVIFCEPVYIPSTDYTLSLSGNSWNVSISNISGYVNPG